MLESLLDEISDLGPTRRAALLDRYGSVSAIKSATIEDIAKTPGIGVRLAEAISAHLNNQRETAINEAVNMESGEIESS